MKKTEFSDAQFNAIYPKGIEYHYWTKARNEILADVINQVGLKEKRILEVGCGRGIVVEALRAKGFNCYGVELAPVNVSKLSAFVYTGIGFENLDHKFASTIEVILLLDVIEHIEDERVFLQNIQKTFPNLTHMVITVPARPELWSNYDRYYGHFRRYTHATLQKIIINSGLQQVYNSYFFHGLYILARLLILFNVNREVTVYPPDSRVKKYLHICIALYFRMESFFIPSQIVGTSLISVITTTHD